MDTGQVLIESACSVDRVEEALSALLPMLPEIHYFRFNPGKVCIYLAIIKQLSLLAETSRKGLIVLWHYFKIL